MKIIAVTNQKGGVGKTSTSTAIASILNKAGYKVLLVDADAQCNSTDTYNGQTKDCATLYDLLIDNDDPCPISECIQHTPYGDLIAGDPLLSDADQELSGVDRSVRYNKLKEAFKGLDEFDYDYVIIDTNPSLNTLLMNVLALVDEGGVIIPTEASRYAVQGFAALSHTILNVKKTLNSNISIRGILVVRYDKRTRLGQDTVEALESIAKSLDTKLFDTKISASVRVGEAQACRQPLIEYMKSSKPEKEYEAFVKECFDVEIKGGRK